MPAGDGLDMFEALAAQGRGDERRIVFMSGRAYSPRTERLLACTENPHLEKPLAFGEVFAAIEAVMSK